MLPCGVSSRESSPVRYIFSKVLFSPIKEAIILLICPLSSSWPSPEPGMPALFETTVKSLISGRSRTALISVFGTPENPKPPARTVEEPFMSAMASLAEPHLLSIARAAVVTEKFRRHNGRNTEGTKGLDMVLTFLQSRWLIWGKRERKTEIINDSRIQARIVPELNPSTSATRYGEDTDKVIIRLALHSWVHLPMLIVDTHVFMHQGHAIGVEYDEVDWAMRRNTKEMRLENVVGSLLPVRIDIVLEPCNTCNLHSGYASASTSAYGASPKASIAIALPY